LKEVIKKRITMLNGIPYGPPILLRLQKNE
jgi:hypothetical protein